ncbi:MAG TPA: low temperature requirement protein A [Xanthobacteraceae bacterium]|nr:low temperature requirement protein A [Xanthobacteraceae bacterium]
MFGARINLLRVRRGHDHHPVTYIELFFDLVFVFAVTQLSHGLLKHFTVLGLVQTALLTFGIWWIWVFTAWITNWLDPDRPAVRLMLVGLMLAGLVLACAIPTAFGDRGLVFALAYVGMQVGRTGFMLWALKRHDPGNFRNFTRIFVWFAVAALFWIAGAFVDGTTRLCVWAIALAIEYVGPSVYFWVPGLGRSSTADWQIEGAHLAERCGLFIIIALGESILITGATFAELTWTPTTIAAFVVAFTGSAAMWAVYFNIGAKRASRHIAASDDPGRMGRSGYTYLHVLIVAGIIVVAVGDELVLHHPDGHTGIGTVAAIVGGPALYLIGNALFKRLSISILPTSHLVGLGLLAALAPAAAIVTPLVLSAATTAILIAVVTWEWLWVDRGKTAKAPSH